MPNPDLDVGLLRTVFFASVAGVVQLDPATQVMIRCNDRFAHVLGYAASELEGTPWQSICHRDDIVANDTLRDELVNLKRPNYSTTKRFMHKLGFWVWMSLQMDAVRNEAGQVVSLVAQIFAPPSSAANADPAMLEQIRLEARKDIIKVIAGIVAGLLTSVAGFMTKEQNLIWLGGAISLVSIGGVAILDKIRLSGKG